MLKLVRGIAKNGKGLAYCKVRAVLGWVNISNEVDELILAIERLGE